MDSRTNIKSTIENLSFPSAWKDFFPLGDHKKALINGTIALLRDYCGENDWVPSIWSYSYHHTHKEVINDFLNQKKYSSNKLFFGALVSKLKKANKLLNPGGSLVKRLAFVMSIASCQHMDLVDVCYYLSQDQIDYRNQNKCDSDDYVDNDTIVIDLEKTKEENKQSVEEKSQHGEEKKNDEVASIDDLINQWAALGAEDLDLEGMGAFSLFQKNNNNASVAVNENDQVDEMIGNQARLSLSL
jgi:hypothetical protein